MKNQFDIFFEGQKKAMEFWNNLSSQMAESVKTNGHDNKKEKEEAQDLFTEWFKKQQAFFEQAMQSGANPQQAFEKAPEQVQQWMEMQNDFAKRWVDFYRENAEKMGLKMPEFPGSYQPSTFFEEGVKNWKNWMEQGNQWASQQVLDKMPFNMRPHYTNFMETFDFMRRYWEPMQRLIQNGLFTKDMVDKYFTPDAYQKVVNQMMGFRPIGNVSELIENINQWFENYFSFAQQGAGEWGTVSDAWKEKMREYMSKGNLPFFEMAADFNNRLRDQMLPFYNIMAQGRQTEMAKLMRDLQFAYIAFVLKSAELQSKVYEAGQFALPDTLRDFYKQYKDKQEMVDYQEFFQHFVNKLENSLLETLHADDYSKLQSEVAAIGTQIKSMTDKATELMGADLPFLTKTDGDDFAKEVNALRRKVRTLEQKIADMEKALLLASKPAVAKEKEETTASGRRTASTASKKK